MFVKDCIIILKMLSIEKIHAILNSYEAGFKHPSDEHFAAANESIVPKFKKQGVISVIAESSDDESERWANI